MNQPTASPTPAGLLLHIRLLQTPASDILKKITYTFEV
jgi:hypothetical protein